MKKDKISKLKAVKELKALGLSEADAIGTINIRLAALKLTQKRQQIDAIINRIEEIEEEKQK